jgi:hypothetical protein
MCLKADVASNGGPPVQRRFFPFTGLLAVTLLPLALCGLAFAGPGPASGGQPPLILISIDGYRADYLDRGHSPVLAALAADGVRAKGAGMLRMVSLPSAL